MTSARLWPLQVRVLGPVRAWLGDQPLDLGPARQQALLAVLAFRANRPVSRDEIIDALWGDAPPPSAVNGVHTYVKGLRQALEPRRRSHSRGDVLVSESSGYVLALAPEQFDAISFEHHIGSARRLRTAGDLVEAERALESALELWHGPPLSGIEGSWADIERARLLELHLKATEDRLDVMLAAGRPADAAADLVKLVGEHPLRERFRGQLMLALYRCGRQADAMAAFADARRALVTELGVEPGPDLRRIHDLVLRADPEIASPPTPAADQATRPIQPTRPTRPRELPAGPAYFTGRASELRQLSELLEEAQEAQASGSPQTLPVSVIGGAPGVGKTALALHWAHQVAERFPDGQLYVNLRGFDPAAGPVAPAAAVRRFLSALAVPDEGIPAELDAQAALYRSLLAGKRVLVVLDNARDDRQVRPLLPGSPTCMVVVTSRVVLAGLVAGEGARPLTLGVLSADEARLLLARRAGPGRVAAEEASAGELARLCARLPLALAIAAARVATCPQLTLAALAAELRDQGGPLHALDAGAANADVRAAFSWSQTYLTAGSARVFRLLALHPGPDISVAAAASLAGLPIGSARATLTELTRSHLLTEHRPGRFAFHDLLRAYAAECADATERPAERDAAVRRMHDHYLHTGHAAALVVNPPTRQPIGIPPAAEGVQPEAISGKDDALAWMQAEQHVLPAVITHAADHALERHAWQQAWTLATFLDRGGRWQDSADVQQIALRAARQSGDLAGQAHAHLDLGYACARLGDHRPAGTHLTRSRVLFEQLDDRLNLAHAHIALSICHETQGAYDDALSHAEQAFGLYQAAGHLAGQATGLNSVGWNHALLGNYTDAASNCRKALTLHNQLGNGFGAAAAWDSLGYAHHKLGQYAEAIRCYRNALSLLQELHAIPPQGDVLIRLGDAHLDASSPDAAKSAWQQALVILDDLHDPGADDIRAKLADRRSHAHQPR